MSRYEHLSNGYQDNVEGRRTRGPMSLLRSAVRALGRWRTRAVTLRELRRLNPRLLKDIGLDAGDLHALADDMSWSVSVAGPIEAGSTTRRREIQYLGPEPGRNAIASSSKRAA